MAEKKRFEQLLRPVFEARAAVGWAIAGLWMLGIAILFRAPKVGLLACAILAGSMAALRLLHAQKLLRYKMSLVGKPTVIMSAARMMAALPKMGPNLWLGWGATAYPARLRDHEARPRGGIPAGLVAAVGPGQGRPQSREGLTVDPRAGYGRA